MSRRTEQPPRRRRVDWRDDAGMTGGTEVLPFGVLIFVIGTLIVMNLWAVIDTKFAVNAAAAEAARAIAEAPNGGAASTDARTAAELALQGFGRSDPDRFVIPKITNPASGQPLAWHRCAEFKVETAYKVPLINIPLIGLTWGPGPVTVTAQRGGVVDPFRASAAPGGDCQ